MLRNADCSPQALMEQQAHARRLPHAPFLLLRPAYCYLNLILRSPSCPSLVEMQRILHLLSAILLVLGAVVARAAPASAASSDAVASATAAAAGGATDSADLQKQMDRIFDSLVQRTFAPERQDHAEMYYKTRFFTAHLQARMRYIISQYDVEDATKSAATEHGAQTETETESSSASAVHESSDASESGASSESSGEASESSSLDDTSSDSEAKGGIDAEGAGASSSASASSTADATTATTLSSTLQSPTPSPSLAASRSLDKRNSEDSDAKDMALTQSEADQLNEIMKEMWLVSRKMYQQTGCLSYDLSLCNGQASKSLKLTKGEKAALREWESRLSKPVVAGKKLSRDEAEQIRGLMKGIQAVLLGGNASQ
ncbi:hypothetical protein GQ54DRAFT_2747 [Martensiomyces pterosporus]|nr:hypothetical protein GQ54DRAFT_2747 [Martensiomyces pterosporus]